jgi:hypothetical protein
MKPIVWWLSYRHIVSRHLKPRASTQNSRLPQILRDSHLHPSTSSRLGIPSIDLQLLNIERSTCRRLERTAIRGYELRRGRGVDWSFLAEKSEAEQHTNTATNKLRIQTTGTNPRNSGYSNWGLRKRRTDCTLANTASSTFCSALQPDGDTFASPPKSSGIDIQLPSHCRCCPFIIC